MKSFSLLTLMLLVVIAALAVSQFIMMRQLSEATAEVDVIRRRYGHIRVEDPSKTYVAGIVENEEHKSAYRIIVPAGSRYLLHLSDVPAQTSDLPANPTPTETISLNGWQEGADVVLSYALYWENNTVRVLVHTETEEMFDYVLPDWTSGSGPSEITPLQPSGQTEHSPDDTIRFVWWRHTGAKRGIMLWLEPYAKGKARMDAEQKAAENAEANPE